MSVCDDALVDVAGVDEAFVGDLYAEHGKAVLAYVLRLGAGRHDAEVIVQETILRGCPASVFSRSTEAHNRDRVSRRPSPRASPASSST